MIKLKRKHKIIAITVGLLLVISLIITYVNSPNIPTWDDIFNFFGISNTKVSTNNSVDGKKENLYVHFINVGKADCTYIRYKDKNILIDAGDTGTKSDVLRYLKKQNIQKLDLMLISHPHKDHIGASPEILKDYNVNNFMMIENSAFATYKTYSNMMSILNRKCIAINSPKLGDTINFYEISFELIPPKKIYKEVNNNSIVARLKYDNISFLFTGDIQKARELDMIEDGLNLEATVIKVPHHASASSSTLELLRNVKPKYAVIHVGPSKHRLPANKIIKRYKRAQITTYRTDECGDILAITDGNTINFQTEKVA